MKDLLTLLVLFLSIFQCRAGRLADTCEVVVLDTRMMGLVNVTTFGCQGAKGPTFSSLDSSPVTRRQANACTLPAPTCQSTVPHSTLNICSQSQTAAPVLSDCVTLNDLIVGNGESGTTIIAPECFISVAFETCEFRWGNLDSVDHEYSFFNWGSLGLTLYDDCVTNGHTAGGFVVSSNNLWFVQTVAAPSM